MSFLRFMNKVKNLNNITDKMQSSDDNYNKNMSIFPSINILTKEDIQRMKEIKEKSSITIEVEIGKFKPAMKFQKPDELSDIEFVKCLENCLISLRRASVIHDSNLNISFIGKRKLDHVRYSVRKSFEEKNTRPEELEYIDFETAKNWCPKGYHVYDVITGEIVYSNFLDVKEDKCNNKYENMWESLKKKIYLIYGKSRNVNIPCQTVLDIIHDLEKEYKDE